jgi:hypothetical protein
MKIWTPRELARALELRMQGIPWKDTAKELGRSESSVWVKLHGLGIKLRPDGNNKEAVRENLIRLHREFVEKAEATETSAPVVESEKPEIPAPSGDNPTLIQKSLADTTVDEDMETTRRHILLAEARESKKKYAEVLRQRAVEDRVVDVFRERLESFVPTARPPLVTVPRASLRAGRRPEAAVLMVSDTHVGQVVSRSQTNGFGDYCPKVYCERLFYLQESVIEVLGQSPNGIDELNVLLMGDIVHGLLNHGAEREDTLLVADQFQLATWTLHQFLCALALHVPTLKVTTVVGNHGRWPHQRKMPTSNRFSNLDHLVYSALQLSITTHGVTNITIDLNDAPRQILDIKNSRFLIAHGDHLRGGDKQFGVPIHSMSRDVNATSQRYAAAEEKPVDYFLVGDKHRSMSLPLARGEFIINGSMVGVDEFAMVFCPSEPMQMLFAVDSVMRKTWAHPIKVAYAPKLTDCPYDLPGQIQYLVEDEESRDQKGVA